MEGELDQGGEVFGVRWEFLVFLGRMGVQVFVVECDGCRVCWGGMGVGLGWWLLRESTRGVWEVGDGCGAGKAREFAVEEEMSSRGEC